MTAVSPPPCPFPGSLLDTARPGTGILLRCCTRGPGCHAPLLGSHRQPPSQDELQCWGDRATAPGRTGRPRLPHGDQGTTIHGRRATAALAEPAARAAEAGMLRAGEQPVLVPAGTLAGHAPRHVPRRAAHRGVATPERARGALPWQRGAGRPAGSPSPVTGVPVPPRGVPGGRDAPVTAAGPEPRGSASPRWG